MSVQKKGRTLAITVNELMSSQRLRIALDMFDTDPMYLKAILIELGHECLQVGKNTVIKAYSTHSSLDAFEMTPFLRNISDFTTFNIWFGNMSKAEQELYMTIVNNKKATKEELKEKMDAVHKQLMQYVPKEKE